MPAHQSRRTAQTSNLRLVDLYNCTILSGTIVSNWAPLVALETFGITRTLLSGTLATAELPSMNFFAVYESRVSGSLPVTLFPPTMQMLYLSNSLISGTVPKNMSAATSLIKLMAGKLALSGTLPDAFTNLIKFSVLCVNDDHLSGIVPPTLGRVGSRATTYMKRMLLDNNRFSGSSPVNISFDRLQFFGISFNRALDWDLNLLSNPLSTLKYAMLQGCGIRGTLPVELPPDMEILLLHDNNSALLAQDLCNNSSKYFSEFQEPHNNHHFSK